MTRGFAFADLANVGAVVLDRPLWLPDAGDVPVGAVVLNRPSWLPDAGDVPVGAVVLDRPPWARGIDSCQVRLE
jgi:hypothetical protein